MTISTNAQILIVVLISFLGFITENIFICFRSGKMDNRNMFLPFLLGYGLAVLTIYKLFGTPNSPTFLGKEINFENSNSSTLYYFAITFLCICIGELLLGHIIEWTCRIEWWNYTSIPLHITKYTSVPTSAAFGLFITLFMKYAFLPLMDRFSQINYKTLSSTAIIMLVLLSIDFIHSGIYMFKNQKTLQIWNIEFKHPLKEIFKNAKRSR